MFFWIVIAILTVTASLSVLMPLYRRRRTDQAAYDQELSVYRDQLNEVDRDVARGLVAESEAEAARTEIARRILRTSDSGNDRSGHAGDMTRRVAVVVAIFAVPLAALGLYLSLGNPRLPDQPIAARLDKPLQEQDIATLVGRVEQHLAANPDDGRGWELLGPVYVRLGRYDDAVIAFSNTLRILGPTAEREADVGEAITRVNGNVVTAEARAAFERAHALDKDAVRPRFYLALALGQAGESEAAIAAWHNLLDGAPANAPWAEAARQALARLEEAPAAPPGPSRADVEAAAAMSPEDRMAMIGGMVDSLAARLEADPDDAQGWARLIRSYMVLNRTEEASAALAKARAEFDGHAEKLTIVETQARAVGLIE